MKTNEIIISSRHQSLEDMYTSANKIAMELVQNYYRVGLTTVLDDTHTAIKITCIHYDVQELESVYYD